MTIKKTGSSRVLRGGSWNNNAQNLRSANRNDNDPGNRNSNIGFRLVSTFSVWPEIVVQGSQLSVKGECPGHYPAPNLDRFGRIKIRPQLLVSHGVSWDLKAVAVFYKAKIFANVVLQSLRQFMVI
jgi:hypothetical protein